MRTIRMRNNQVLRNKIINFHIVCIKFGYLGTILIVRVKSGLQLGSKYLKPPNHSVKLDLAVLFFTGHLYGVKEYRNRNYNTLSVS